MEKNYIIARRMEDGNILKINEFIKHGYGKGKYNIALLIPEEGEKVGPDFFKNGKEKLIFPKKGYIISRNKINEIYYPINSTKQFEKFVRENS